MEFLTRLFNINLVSERMALIKVSARVEDVEAFIGTDQDGKKSQLEQLER